DRPPQRPPPRPRRPRRQRPPRSPRRRTPTARRRHPRLTPVRRPEPSGHPATALPERAAVVPERTVIQPPPSHAVASRLPALGGRALRHKDDRRGQLHAVGDQLPVI